MGAAVDIDLARVSDILLRAVERAAAPPSFLPLLDGIREALEACGVVADRIQLPMTRMTGFRHPTLGVVLLTWSREGGYAGTDAVPHAALDALPTHGAVGTPFESVVLHGAPWFRLRLEHDDGGFALLRGLRDRGYRDYIAMGLHIPSGTEPQSVSIAGHAPFPDDVGARLERVRSLLSLAIYSVYRTSQAMRVAEVYIGRESGPRVLAGEIQRGTTREVEAGILFCDLRGFTALSEAVGATAVVQVVNAVFEAVGIEAQARGGEILKFIGDAMLIVFPVASAAARPSVAAALVETARSSGARVAALATELGQPLAVGFGGHLGAVVQGNIGTPDRLDFTVMGPAVNLASRLEGLCRPLGVPAVFSGAVAEHAAGLEPAGTHALRGIGAPVDVWRIGG